jgi:hypothetical protein
MSQWTLAKIGLAAALILAADLSAAVARDHHGSHVRRRIGRIVVVPPFQHSGVGVLMRAGSRDIYDYYGERRVMPGTRRQLGQKEIISSLHRRGFRSINVTRHRGSIYILEATGPGGERVRLIVNALTGGIDGVRALGTSRHFRLP